MFEKVERMFGMGLRAADPAMREKFFALYDRSLQPTLFERLRFIICVQNWDEMANTFWLKQGLVSGSCSQHDG